MSDVARPWSDVRSIVADLRSDRRVVVTAVILLVFAAAAVMLGWLYSSTTSSSAAFADVEAVDGNRLGAGVVDIDTGARTQTFAAAGLAAGDEVTGRLELQNAGDLALTYRLRSTSSSGPLRDHLEVSAWESTGSCDETIPRDAAIWAPLLDETPGGAPAVGDLAPGESRLICMLGRLPIDAPSDAQGRRLDLIIGVDAEHDVDATEEAARGARQDGGG